MIKSLYRKLLSEKQRIALHYALYKIEAAFLKGDRYECCCCGKSSRRFLSHGDKGPRKNIKCPHCLSLERTRILCMYLRNEILDKTERPISILHFAPVKGLKDFLKSSPHVSVYHDADINPNVATYQCDITQMPYIIRKTKCFDFWERNVLFPKTKRSFFRTPTPSTLPFSA